jgi:hypothetical protein
LRVQSEQLLAESQVFEDEVLAGAKRADDPPEKMPERHNHGKNIIGTIRIQLFCQVIHFAGVRRFGEAQACSVTWMSSALLGVKSVQLPIKTPGCFGLRLNRKLAAIVIATRNRNR